LKAYTMRSSFSQNNVGKNCGRAVQAQRQVSRPC
jgi:hypothetical protein